MSTKGDNLSCTPLIAAVEDGHVEALQLLCAHGADVNCTFTDEQSLGSGREELHSANSAFMLACKKGRQDIAEELIKNSCCDINIQNMHGNTALHLACHSYTYPSSPLSDRRVSIREQHRDIVSLLLAQSGCDYDVKNTAGENCSTLDN